jgi:hypothetical protein
MSQATLPTSSARSSVTSRSQTVGSLLHPQVKVALSYLDSSLEDELTRYRKARSGKRVAPSSVRIMQGSSKLTSKAEVELTRFVPFDQMPKVPPHVLEDRSLAGAGKNSETHAGTGPQPLATEFLDQLAVIPEDGLSLSYNFNDLLDNPSIDNLSLTETSYGAEDYLESSEELLRSLAQEEADAEAERSGLENLMTPFGVGSMLLMLMASGMFGYLVMNPTTFASIGSLFSRLFTAPIASNASGPTATTGESGEIPTGNELMDLSLNNLAVLGTQGRSGTGLTLPIAGNPGKGLPTNLATAIATVRQPNAPVKSGVTSGNKPAVVGGGVTGGGATGSGLFQGGNSSLGGEIFRTPDPQPADPQPSDPAPRSQPRRSAAPRQSAPAYRAPVYSPPTYSAPRTSIPTVPVELPPAPSTPTSIPPAPVESATPAAASYRVEAPYTSDRDLEKAQQADPGAYFKNGDNGAVVQMGGSYNTREEAEAKAQELKSKGFNGVEVVK